MYPSRVCVCGILCSLEPKHGCALWPVGLTRFHENKDSTDVALHVAASAPLCDAKKPLSCPTCGKTFKYPSWLNQHRCRGFDGAAPAAEPRQPRGRPASRQKCNCRHGGGRPPWAQRWMQVGARR